MSLATDSRFKSLKQGDHVCAIHESPGEQIDAIIQYIKIGLSVGERCLYIVADRSGDEIKKRLATAGVDVAAALESGRLSLKTKRETYLQTGHFNPDRMIEFLRTCESEALSEGYSGLRLVGEMGWALGPEFGCHRVTEYESRCNQILPGSRTHAICQYDRSRFPAKIIHDVLRSHPIALVSQTVCSNPYYEPPHVAAGADQYSERVNWMLSRILDIRRHELELEEAVQERDEFLSVASQEIRTPLHALNLALHVANHGTDLDESVQRNITRAQRQVERLNRLIGVVRDASSIREGRLEWNFGTFELKQLAQVTAAYFEIDAKHLGYTIRVSGDAVWGNWDAERICQILHNLLSNAIKYGAGKPIVLAIGTRGGFAEIAVVDQGIGIDADHLSDIFDRFGRPSSAHHYAGMGLGLWLVHKLVEAMHGTVHVQSEVGEGTRFLVRLPLDSLPSESSR